MSTTTNAPFLIFISVVVIWGFFSFTSPPKLLASFFEGKQITYVETQKLVSVVGGSMDLYEQKGHPIGPLHFHEKDVVELTAKSLRQFLMDESNQYVMVQFYAPWCYWSQRLRGAYAEAAMKLKGQAVLVKVDASEEALFMDDYKVNGYPTMLFFVNGVYVDTYWSGNRSSDDIVTWVRGNMGSLIYNVTTKESGERILAAKSMIVLAFVDALEGAYTEELAAASKLHTDVHFYQTSCADVAKMFHIDPQIKSPALVVLKKESGIHNHLDGQFNSRAIAEFVSSSKHSLENPFIFDKASKFRQESTIAGLEAHPLQIDEKDVVELSTRNLSEFLMAKSNQYVMVQFYASWCFWSKSLRGAYAAAATKLKGVAVLSKVDASKETIVGKEYKIDGYPTLRFFVNGAYVDSYYGDRSRDAIATWVKGKMESRIYNITTTQKAELILAAKSMIVFAFVDPLEAPYTEELAGASKLHADVNFYQTDSADVANMFHIDEQIQRPALVVLDKEFGIHHHFHGQFNSKAIAEFVASNKLPLENTFNLENASKVHKASTIKGQEAHLLQIDEKDVVELSARNISQFLMAKSNPYVMVQFYASSCYWSKRLRGAYAAAATKLNGVAVLSKVDVSKKTTVRMEYKIQGYPTMLFFVNGAYVDSYYGERSRDAIATWVKGKMGSQVYNITTIEEAERILASKSMIVLALVDDLEATYTEELAAASKLHTDVNFYQTDCADVAKMFHIDEQIQRPALVVLKKESGIRNHLIGEFTSRAIVELVSSSKHPLLTTFTIGKYPKFFRSPHRLSFLQDVHEDKLSTQPIWT